MTEDRRKISFVNRERLKVVKSREEFIKIKDSCNRNLVGYDLSNIDISNIDMHDFKLEDVVFNYFDVEKKERKEIFNVNFMGCVMERVAFAQCLISRCNFDSYKVTQKAQHNEYQSIKLVYVKYFFCTFVVENQRVTFNYNKAKDHHKTHY